MIKREDFKGINFKKLKKHSKELEEYDGNIPYILYDNININNRINYLKNKDNQYEYKNIKEYRKNLKNTDEIQELLDFINNNPEFEDIIKK